MHVLSRYLASLNGFIFDNVTAGELLTIYITLADSGRMVEKSSLSTLICADLFLVVGVSSCCCLVVVSMFVDDG